VADRQTAIGQGGRPDCQVRESDIYLDSTIRHVVATPMPVLLALSRRQLKAVEDKICSGA
jgi:hypothetical protein